MDKSNLQQWLENSYRHQTKAISSSNDFHFPESSRMFTSEHEYDAVELSLLKQVFNDDYDSIINYTLVSPYDVGNSEERAIPSATLLFMAISYGIVVFGGVIGNATLVLTLCSASAVRLRNPLLLAVCFADLLVTGISAPLTLLNLAMNRKTKSFPPILCRFIHFIQVMPVAASTISFFMLSLDRYATVKHPRLAQLRQRRYLHVTLALLSWITSAAISAPFFFAYNIIAKTVVLKEYNESQKNLMNSKNIGNVYGNNFQTIDFITEAPPFYPPTTINSDVMAPEEDMKPTCTIDFSASTIFASFVIFHTIAVFVLPGIGVLLNHYGVRKKLCALSLTARAAHGELPLPMPILRRQTHIVVVAGIAHVQQAAGTTDDTSNGGDIQMQNLKPRLTDADQDLFKSSNPISPRAMREIRAHSQRQRVCNGQNGRGPATPGIPLPQTSTLRSRRHLANMLIASALIFIVCWSPHVFCIFYKNLGYKQYCTKTSTYFNLLLGYMYSAISPVIYWALNHNTLRQSPCAPLIRLRSMQKFLRTRFRSHAVPPPPSSTNEAALGAFNPKLIKLTPKQYRAQASSHYLY